MKESYHSDARESSETSSRSRRDPGHHERLLVGRGESWREGEETQGWGLRFRSGTKPEAWKSGRRWGEGTFETADVQPTVPGGTSGKCEGCCAGRSGAKAASLSPGPWWPRGLLGAEPRVAVQGEGWQKRKGVYIPIQGPAWRIQMPGSLLFLHILRSLGH